MKFLSFFLFPIKNLDTNDKSIYDLMKGKSPAQFA